MLITAMPSATSTSAAKGTLLFRLKSLKL